MNLMKYFQMDKENEMDVMIGEKLIAEYGKEQETYTLDFEKNLYLLEYSFETDNNKALGLVENRLINMYKGGLFDHIGYGFFTEVDKDFFVPSFEKTLIDNVEMAILYGKAYEITKKKVYMDISDKIIYFILRHLEVEKNRFKSKFIVDKEYYLIEKNEIIDILGDDFGNKFTKTYDICEEGNYKGKNIPNLKSQDLSNMDSSIESMLEMIAEYRTFRPHKIDIGEDALPETGCLIGALSYLGLLFENNYYVRKSKEIAEFLIEDKIEQNASNCYRLKMYEENTVREFDYLGISYGMLTLGVNQNIEKYRKIGTNILNQSLNIFEKPIVENSIICSTEDFDIKLDTKYIHPYGYYKDRLLLLNLRKAFNITGKIEYVNIVSKLVNRENIGKEEACDDIFKSVNYALGFKNLL